MARDPELAVRFAALSVAYRAQVAELPRWMVAELVQTSRQLEPDHILAQAIRGFEKQFTEHRLDHERMYRLGGDLKALVESLNVPVPPDIQRKDIYG